jgi:hypothetical protein
MYLFLLIKDVYISYKINYFIFIVIY